MNTETREVCKTYINAQLE